jgi:hypothetical protein
VKALRYAIILMILIQLVLPWIMPINQIYHNRVDYNITKDNRERFEPALEQIKLEIIRKHLKDYIIIIGDSVLYSSPGNSDQAYGGFRPKNNECHGYIAPYELMDAWCFFAVEPT